MTPGVGVLEHMRDVDRGDDLALRLERVTETYEINPSKANLKKLKAATKQLSDYTNLMAKKYGADQE